MKWKLLIMLSVILTEIYARPAEETSTTAEVLTTTNLKNATVEQTTAHPTESASNRYFTQHNNNPTNRHHSKYHNNYNQLITKHNIHRLHEVENKTNNKRIPIMLPSFIITSSSSEYNSSSKPLTFNKDLTVPPKLTATPKLTTQSYLNNEPTKKSSTQQKIEQRKNLVTINNWSNYELDPIVYEPIQKLQKPVIQKVITKWSDDINYQYYPYNDTTDYKINKLSDIFGSQSPTLTSYFDQLPAILSQQLIKQSSLPPQPTQVVYSSPISENTGIPVTSYAGLSNKLEIPTEKPRPKPIDENDPNPPYPKYPYATTNYEDAYKQDGCKKYKQYYNQSSNYVDICDDADNQIVGDDVENISYDDKLDLPYDVEDAQPLPFPAPVPAAQNDFTGTGIDGGFLGGQGPAPAIFTTLSQFLPSGGSGGFGNNNRKKHKFGGKKKKHGKKKKNKHNYEENGLSISKITAVIMTILTIFNPMNLGVVGLMAAPMFAMMFGGMCYALYKFMVNNKHSYSPPFENPSTVVIKNRVKHYPIPIHVTHHYSPQEPHPVMKTKRPYHTHSDSSPDYYIDWQPPNAHKKTNKNHKFKLL